MAFLVHGVSGLDIARRVRWRPARARRRPRTPRDRLRAEYASSWSRLTSYFPLLWEEYCTLVAQSIEFWPVQAATLRPSVYLLGGARWKHGCLWTLVFRSRPLSMKEHGRHALWPLRDRLVTVTRRACYRTTLFTHPACLYGMDRTFKLYCHGRRGFSDNCQKTLKSSACSTARQ